ncbi:MAG: 1-deoxy-D-xylulose-5-phosphate synthase [Clostridia bacterium]|nr:1-deoxy-D-xylulose-5-phosphate synthase [Clostridia bacterium]
MRTRLLDKLNSPRDIRKFEHRELQQLAEEIRQEIIETVASNGGHLAPNLGVVELTLALHLVFETPRDKIVWDVGHQSYVHKLLTGRRNEFHTLRQLDGISGFPKRTESDHDAFDTGHSSTSISAAVGMAAARDLKQDESSVVAVIGDGALTGGMAFEALNHAGHLGTNLIVVLNDNEMSIAENVGALSGYLSRMRSDPKYFKGKEDIEHIISRIPRIGPNVVRVLERIKDSFKYLVVPGMLFEELGFTYFGPIDGHNTAAIRQVLQDAKNHGGPVLVHVLTRKGKGYQPAETNPDKFHGISPFEVKTGEVHKEDGPPSYTEIFGGALTDLAKDNLEILAITAAMPSGTGLNRFAKEFPQRFFDVGIAEQHAVTMAAGMATQGFKPVVAVYSTFLQRAYDQVLHDVCLQKLPVILALDRAGFVGEDGPTHHGVFDLAYLRHIPNMIIMAPKDENELRHMLKTAVDYAGPVTLRYPRGAGVGVPLDAKLDSLPIGRAEILRPGQTLTLLALGTMVYPALEAAEILAEQGIDLRVINARFAKPLDEEAILEAARNTGGILTIEEHALHGGFGSGVMELLEAHNLKAIPFKRLGIPDEFVEHGPIKVLREKFGLSAEGIVAAVLENFKLSRRTPGKAKILIGNN